MPSTSAPKQCLEAEKGEEETAVTTDSGVEALRLVLRSENESGRRRVLGSVCLLVLASWACGPSERRGLPPAPASAARVRTADEHRVDPPQCLIDADCGSRPNAKTSVCQHGGFCTLACLEFWGDCNRDYRDGCEAPIKHRFYCDGDPRIEKEQHSSPIAGVFVTGSGVGPGRLDMGEFSVALGPYRAGLQACYERALADAPGIHGAWSYEFTIGPDGSVTSNKLVSAAARNADLEACIAEYAASIRLPIQPSGGSVTFPCRVVFVAPRGDGGE